MFSLFSRAVIIHKGERKAVAILFLHYFLVSAAAIAGKSARDALFLSHYGKSALPIMYVANAVVIAAAVAIFSRLTKTSTTRTISTGSLAVFAGSLALMSMRLNGFMIAVLYIWIESIGALALLQAWNLAGNAFDPRQAKRLFGIIAAGGSIAAAAGGAGVAFLASRYGPPVLVGAVAAMLAMAGVTAWFASAFEAPRPRMLSLAPAAPKKLRPYTMSIAVVVVASAILSVLVQYRFQVGAAAAYPDRSQMIAFFGRFYSWTGAASLVVQLFLSRLLISRFGPIAGLAVIPLCFSLGSLFSLFSAALWSVGFSRFSDLTFKFTLNNTAIELLWLPVPGEERRAVKPFVAGTLKTVSEAATGLLMFFVVNVAPMWVLSAVALAVCSIWIGTVHRLQGLYRSALAAVISKRQLDAGTLRIDAHDPTVIASIEQVLRTGDDAEQISALGFLDGFSVVPWTNTLRTLHREGSADVSDAVLRVTADDPYVIPDEWILESVRAGVPAAIQVAAHRRIAEAKPLLIEMLDSDNVETSIAAAAALLREGDDSTVRSRIERWLDTDDPRTLVKALDALPPDIGRLDPARLRRCLHSADAGAVRAALRVAGATRDERVIGDIVECLFRPRCAMQARIALRQLPEAAVVEALTAAVTSDATDDRLRCCVLRALSDYPTSIAESRIGSKVSIRFVASYQEYAALLEAIARARTIERSVADRVAHDLKDAADLAHGTEALGLRFSVDPDAILLRDYVEQRRSAAVAIVIRLTALGSESLPAQQCLELARSSDRARLPYVLELIEASLPREQARLLIPLIDTKQEQSPRVDLNLDEAVDQLALYAPKSDAWASSIVRHYEARKKDANTGDEMHSILEKTIYLKTSEIFGGVAAESLSRLAAIAVDSTWPSGSIVFREGDIGDALYVVLSGGVRIVKGGIEIATLKKGACFGEMAVLDGAPRSADAIVSDEAGLLRIGAEEFYEALAENPPLMRNVIALLTRRLRDTNAVMARATAK